MDAAVSIRGAEPWSTVGVGVRARTAVVVVHGFTTSPIVTRPLGQHLAAAGYTIEVPLLPGHGTSHHDLAETRYDDWAGAVARLLDHFGARCDQVVLIGHGLGGTIALDLASQRPQDVAALVVINPRLSPPARVRQRSVGVLHRLFPLLPRAIIGLPPDDVALDGVEQQAYAWVPTRAARSLWAALPRVHSQLPSVVAPLLVVRSPQDRTVAESDGRQVLEGAGSWHTEELLCTSSHHVPQLDVDAVEVATTIDRFLDTVLAG
ncbi:MAG: alpha/beta fold hydrolase [Nitriliruptoraceae bacterium]